MADWMPQAVETLGTVLGGGVVVVLLQGWNERRKKDQSLQGKDREDAIGILREALTEKRRDHTGCLERVEKVEAAMFREREVALADRAACSQETTFLREVALEAYTRSTPPAKQDPVILAKLRRPSAARELGPPEGVLDQDSRKG